MAADAKQQAEDFKALMEEKIRTLVGEFAEGKISREQFHVLYERYSSRLAITNHALFSGTPEAISIVQDGLPTVAIKEAYTGKAMGMVIYHNKSGMVIETLGDFDVSVTTIAPVLNDFSRMMTEKQLIDRRIEKIDTKQWLLFSPGQFSTVVTLFYNEPSQEQMREIERLHHDFEEANRTSLEKEVVDGEHLAYPFLIFIKQKFRR
ncbi:MAG: hypothetical protein H7Y09_03020 [Chitinophagaceae bacterium]|nr:hypothetical protein [Anaerolineae bacterium]